VRNKDVILRARSRNACSARRTQSQIVPAAVNLRTTPSLIQIYTSDAIKPHNANGRPTVGTSITVKNEYCHDH
jgi:hypothetical protein